LGNSNQLPESSPSSNLIFGDALRTLRHAAGMTQAELAERANLSLRGLSDLERGVNRYPRRETLLALADAFGLVEDERARFFMSARRRPAHSSPGPYLPPTRQEMEPPLRHLSTESAANIQVFLIADVRGYTTYKHSDEEAAEVAMRFAAISREVIESHGGRIIDLRGNEVQALFISARAALGAAVELQQHLVGVSAADPEQPLQCGIGLEAGEAFSVEDGYQGLAINLAARLCSQAGPGEILAGETIIGLARRVAGLVFQDRGLTVFKEVATPVRVVQVLPKEATEHVLESEAAPEEVEATVSEQVAGLPQVVGNFLWARPEHRLVAREVEMGQLLTALNAVQLGTGRLIFLMGEPGVGKTRLAQEVSLAALERGFFVITGRCYAPQETVPYYPFLEALSRAFSSGSAAARAALPERWPQVARLLPERHNEAPLTQEGSPSGSAEDQQRLFWQVSGFLQALAAERPLAVLLDDLHWMDGASLALLLHLARHTRESPILLLGTYRDIEVAPTHPLAKGIHDLGRERLMERIEVQRLAREGTAELLSATLDDGQVSETVTALIHGPTEGNAFFAQEVLRALVERGDVTLIDGQWELRAGVDVVLPENVRVIILERVARLSPAAREVLAVASVWGQTFRFDDLLAEVARVRHMSQPSPVAEAAEVSAELALEEELEEAVCAQVVREAGGVRYAFSHVLTQRALYEQLSARRRHRLHLAVAETIESLPERERTLRVAEAAYHFLQAEEFARALPYLLLGGDQAQAVYANTEAEQHFQTAARLAVELGNLEIEAEALERLGLLHWWNLGNYNRATDMLEQAVKAQKAAKEGRIRSQTAGMLARSYGRSGHPEQALAVLAPWLDVKTKQLRAESEPLAIQASLAIAFADVCFHTGAYPAQLEAAERAARIWGELGDARAQVDALLLQGIALRVLGHWQEGLAVLEETVKRAGEVGALYVCAHASYHMGYSYLQSGEWEQAAAAIEVALDLNKQSGNQMFYGSSTFLKGLLEYHRGDWAAARHWFERAQRHYGHSSREETHAYAPIGPGLIRAVTGDLEEGLRYLQEAISICQEEGVPFILHRAQREMAEVELVLGRTAEARMQLQSIVEASGYETYNDVTPLLPLLAWTSIELGDESQAEALLERAALQAQAQRHYLALLDVLRVRGLLCIKQQHWQEGREVLDQALALAQGMPHPYAEAKVLYTAGCLEAAHGDPAIARQHFTAALTICSRLGERLYAEPIEREVSALDL
jgi:class 3 adenylate cyclase/tetratricopeptide (TPR) repeat protein/DNA-binding XRE family transcriptional regulator